VRAYNGILNIITTMCN